MNRPTTSQAPFRHALAAVGLIASGVRGQCAGYTLEPGPGSLPGQVAALTTWDPDGAGPNPATLVASGYGTAGYSKVWDGSGWQTLGPQQQHSSLTTLNGDLVAGGGFASATAFWSVSKWDGSAWTQLGDNQDFIAPPLRRLAVHQGQLFATGGHEFIRLEGSSWQSLGPDDGEYANAIAFFNGDLIGGGFLRINPLFGGYAVIRWGGAPQAWDPLMSGVFVYALTVHEGRLIAGADYGVWQWDGTAWTQLGTDLYNIFELVSYRGQLIAGGNMPGGVRRWDGASWVTLGAGVTGGSGPSVERMVEWNGDLIIAGRFTNAGGLPAGNIARYRCIPCYANCDNSLNPPILNANDFQCFLNAFARGDTYANCDGSTQPPILNVNDFQCFVNQFAGGCP